MTEKIAIDIALLPPNEIMDLAIELNRNHGPKFLLNKRDYLPHITLSQAIVKQDDLDEVFARLVQIKSKFKPIHLKANIISNFIEPHKSHGLINLHETIMRTYENLISYDARAEYFCDDYVRPKSLQYVRDFKKLHAFTNFYPHITLGTTKHIKNEPDVSFTAKQLVICHLGDYNTCRRILFKTFLG